jgi:hypothetical protein
MSEAKNSVMTVDSQAVAAINAAEIDNQIVTAHRFPRDERTAIDKSIRLATFTPQIAQSCIYMRPVGKKDGIQQFACGPSIRLAEVMKSSWGNIRIRTEVIGVRDGLVGVRWAVHDLESNVAQVGEVWRPYFGADKMIPVITAAAMKIAERDAVFAVVPKAYAEMVMQDARKAIVGEGEDKAALYSDVVASFGDKGIEIDTLLSIIDRKDYPQGSDEELVLLIGLNNAIADGLVKIEEVFGADPKQSSKPRVQPSKVTKPEDKPAPKAKKAAPAEEKTPKELTDSQKAVAAKLAEKGIVGNDEINAFIKQFGCDFDSLPADAGLDAILCAVDDIEGC